MGAKLENSKLARLMSKDRKLEKKLVSTRSKFLKDNKRCEAQML